MSATAALLTQDRDNGEANKVHLYSLATRKAKITIIVCKAYQCYYGSVSEALTY